MRHFVLLLSMLLCVPAQGDLLTELSAPPAASLPRLSPDGEFIALSRQKGAYRYVSASRVGEQAEFTVFASDSERIEQLHWLNDQRLLLRLRRAGGAVRFLAVERNGHAPLSLTPEGAHGDTQADPVLVDELPSDPVHILLALPAASGWSLDVHRVNVYTGERRLVETGSGQTYVWGTDRDGRLRLRSDWAFNGRSVSYRHFWRPTVQSPQWRPFYSHQLGGTALVPLVFGVDGKTLIVAAERADDSLDLHRYDPLTATFQQAVHERAGVDLGAMHFSRVSGAPALIDVPAARPAQVFLDPEWARWQASLDLQMPDTWNHIEAISRNDRLAVVHSYSDRDPGRFLLLDTQALSLEHLATRMESIDPASLQATREVRITARDGRVMQGYWTAARDAARESPMVLYVHGGPWARDHWGFDPMVQWLAANGIAVLQVNYRGSRGFGREWLMAGKTEWGGAMQYDLEDAADWAVRRHLADRSRICIMGGSYGGYAALMGVLTAPERFRCAVAQAPVTDPAALIGAFEDNGNGQAAGEWRQMVGDPVQLARISPIHLAGKLQRPALLIHGDRDRTVPVTQSKRFIDNAAGQSQLLVLEGEDHRISSRRARRAWFAATAEFIQNSLGLQEGVATQ